MIFIEQLAELVSRRLRNTLPNKALAFIHQAQYPSLMLRNRCYAFMFSMMAPKRGVVNA